MSQEKPLILIANDDSIYSKGIRVLVQIMSEMGEVVVVAPDTHQYLLKKDIHMITIQILKLKMKMKMKMNNHQPQNQFIMIFSKTFSKPNKILKLKKNQWKKNQWKKNQWKKNKWKKNQLLL